jgi:ribosome biogenesis GTPase / thiamine phosphate phosphatase
MTQFSLADLGWTSELQAAGGTGTPMRLTSLHKGRAEALSQAGAELIFCPLDLRLAVGDWVLVNDGRITDLLPRSSLLQRRAAGSGTDVQLIAANIDVMFIVTSCNADFNEARLERYLVLAYGSGIKPVLVLTKADMADPAPFVAIAKTLARDLDVVAINAKSGAEALRPWCGKTAVLLGSSGVGKSTLANALTGADLAVGGIRLDDAKGRHTTTARHLIAIPAGGWLIDTPGVRELQLTDVGDGIDVLFQDLAELATECRFRDCQHLHEPNCAVRAAIAAGKISAARLERWRKLLGEEAVNSAAMAQSATKAAGRYTKKSTAKRQYDAS